jgi:hypothetical protein
MFTGKKWTKIFFSILIASFVIGGCSLFSKPVEEENPSQAGEVVSDTETPQPAAMATNNSSTPEAGITPEPTATPVTPIPTMEIGGYAEMVNNLRAAGAQVEAGGEINQPFLEEYNIKGQVLKVNGADIQVFELESELLRALVASQISEDGYTIAMTTIDWLDQPNFWAIGRLVVLYVGSDEAMIDLISNVMGEPITNHP